MSCKESSFRSQHNTSLTSLIQNQDMFFLAIDPSTLFPKSVQQWSGPTISPLSGVGNWKLWFLSPQTSLVWQTIVSNKVHNGSKCSTRVRLCKKRSHITRESKGDTDCSLYLTSFKRRLQIGVNESLTGSNTSRIKGQNVMNEAEMWLLEELKRYLKDRPVLFYKFEHRFKLHNLVWANLSEINYL